MKNPESELILKVSPPRAPRHLLARPRLGSEQAQYRDRPVTLVHAPAGFGKTSLLAQWRREQLARGAAVAWLSVDGSDHMQRLVHGLVLAVRTAWGRPDFGRTLLEGSSAAAGELDGLTQWLAEVAQSALELVLIVDEAERLPGESARAALAYLLNNQPPNLRVLIAMRGEPDPATGELLAYGDFASIGVGALRFTLEETIAAVRLRHGERIDADACARLHELTEGWPLGLQLALAALDHSPHPGAALDAISARPGTLFERFAAGLLLRLAPEDLAFITRIAPLDHLHPDLGRAVTGSADAAERLARLVRDTPLFVADEQGEWYRLHALFREVLDARFAALPQKEQAGIHERAARWLAERDMLEEAAREALASGQWEFAYDLAERSLYDTMARGRQAAVLDWLGHLDERAVDRRPRLRLAAAWALGLSERHEEAIRHVGRILERPGVDEALRYECDLILSGAAGLADQPDRYVALFTPWMEAAPVRDPWLLRVHANRTAFRALLLGEPGQARRHREQHAAGEGGGAIDYVARWGDFVTGLSYLWEGQVLLAEEVLRAAHERAETDLGRRNQQSCMLAALLASALWERDRPGEAAALLANRLDVLERVGLPEALLLAYRTAARLAASERGEHRALDLLESLYSVGAARKLPRLCIASLVEQVRLHARRFRPETCRELCERIDDILAGPDLPQGPLWQRGVQLLRALACGNAAIASQDWPRALEAFGEAGKLAEAAKLGRVRIETMALRAFALQRNGDDGLPLLREATNLAEAYGLKRLFGDAHPALADWAARVGGSADAAPARPVAFAKAREIPAPRATPSTLLTPKEREVLELLARTLANKEIAAAMGVGEETVKWHLKNLFGKLDAGTRKHAVRRARLLGLLEGGD
jgi:LuxR family maltose regulon positive regulatory protein